jgi:hypothetical protein
MSYSDAYDTCMAQKGLPLLGEIFSRHTISEAVATLSEIQDALDAAGGTDITLAALAAAGPAMGLSPSALEVVGVLAGAAATVSMHVYLAAAGTCLAVAAVKASLLSELDAAPDGTFKDQVLTDTHDTDAAA